MKDPHTIIIKPHITEKSVAASYGDELSAIRRKRNELKASTGKAPRDVKIGEEDLVRRYTFIVARDANKNEIKTAVESIYNTGKKADEAITVTQVRTIRLPGKKKRMARVTGGYTPDRKKAIVTLAAGQMLEDYGV